MGYKTIFRKRAAKEYLKSISWYAERSTQAAERFVLAVSETLTKIENNPDQFRKSYKKFRDAKPKAFPFSIVYFIDEKKELIVIISLFHQKRNPAKKFKL